MASIPGLSSSKGRKSHWEEIRKEARQLENQIDVRLVQLSKLGTSLNCSPFVTTTAASGFGENDKTPLLASEDGGSARVATQFKDVSEDISSLLNRLSGINEGLHEWATTANANGTTPSAAIHHTLQRHKDILQDYQQEFNKTKSNVLAAIERHDLLDSVHQDIADYRNATTSTPSPGGGGGGSGGSNLPTAAGNRRVNVLLKENEHARNSERLIDEHISIAMEARETLVNQRVVFKAIQTKLNDISNKFPFINNLIQKINLRKRRDTIIVGSVIGVCLLFLLWYAFG